MKYCTKALPLLFLAFILLFSCSKNVNYTAPPGSTETAINHYSYNTIVINDHPYHTDVVILPDGRIRDWPVESGVHDLEPEDFMGLITDGVIGVIIGRGFHSQADLAEETRDFLRQVEAGGIPIHFLATTDAVNLYNQTPKEGLLAFVRIGY